MPERSSNTLLNAGMILALLTGGFLLIQQPIKSLRPQSYTGIEQQHHTKQLSRLWQDPFEAARTIEKNQSEAKASDGSPKDKPSFNETLWNSFFGKEKSQGEANTSASSSSSKHGFNNEEDILNEMLWNQLLGSKGGFLPNKKSIEYEQDSVTLKGKKVKNALNDFRILAVMVPGKPYQDQVERRIRYRVALVHGMSEAGYHPIDAERIGCLRFQPNTTKDNLKYNKVRNLWISEVEHEIPVPYEWYQNNESKENILVLWIDEDRFAPAPVMLLNILYRRISEARKEIYSSIIPLEQILRNYFSRYLLCCKQFHLQSLPFDDLSFQDDLTFQIVGPYSSTTLRRIYDECDIYAKHELVKEQLRTDLTFYNYSATTYEKANAGLCAAEDKILTEELFNDKASISIHHLVSSDTMLMQAMYRELELRNWRKNCPFPWKSSPQDIILLSENDTTYGRELPMAFNDINDIKDPNNKAYKCVPYNYLRGLDGATAAAVTNAQEQKRLAGTQPPPSEKSSTQIPSRLLPGKHTNPPVGNNQLDYIARLVLDMKQNHHRPFAVGILGSDPYDKLMLLQALRPYFPDTLFFTTDLEAQYLDMQSLQTSHGLLVASSYGLSLHPNIQKRTPPFRGTYQTALFHAVLAAMADKKENKKTDDKREEEAGTIENKPALFLKQQSLPRIFEIGWYNAVDLTIESKQEYKSLTNFQCNRYGYSETWENLSKHNPMIYQNPIMGNDNAEGKASLHPLSPRLTKGWKYFCAKYAWFFWGGILIIAFLIAVNFNLVKDCFFGKWLEVLFSGENSNKIMRRINLVSVALLILMIAICYNHVSPHIGGEPFSLWEGISYWPVLLAHLLVIYLGIIFFLIASRNVLKAQSDAAKEVSLKENERSFLNDRFGNDPNRNLWNVWHMWFRKKDSDSRKTTLGCFVLSVLFFLLMFCESDWTAFRGDGKYLGMSVVFIGMLGAVTMLNILTGIVAASSFFGKQLIKEISLSEAWKKDNTTDTNISLDNSEHYRVIKLIGEWTHTSRSTIWFPVVLLLILTVPRIFVFENFGNGEAIRFCYIVFITLLIFIPSWKFRTRARNLRIELIADLKNQLVISQVSDDAITNNKIIIVSTKAEQSPTINPDQIKIVIEEIEKYQKGIYSNHFWYPVVPILLVLSGGISSPLLWEFFFK